MSNEPESRKGWNGTCVMLGDSVRVHGNGFARGIYANVLSLGKPGGFCKVQITKAGPKNKHLIGAKYDLVSAWLEGEAMI